jgi:hypothetical protein
LIANYDFSYPSDTMTAFIGLLARATARTERSEDS